MAASISPPEYPGDEHFLFPTPALDSPSACSPIPDDAAQISIHLGAGPDSLDVITLVCPPAFSLNVPPHYHPKGTEYMKVLEGEVHGIVNGKSMVMRPEDDWLELPPMTVHTFEKKGGSNGKKTVWMERAGPNPAGKKKFFQDFLGRGEMPGFLGGMAVFYREGDTIPALPGAPYTNFIGHAMVNALGGFAHMTGLDKGPDSREARTRRN